MRLLSGHRIALALAAILTTYALLLPPQPATAETDIVVERIAQGIIDMSAQYTDIRNELEPIDPAEWTIEQHCEYLNASRWVIFLGLCLYRWENNSLPADLPSLAGTAYIPNWPANPYNAWQPITVLSATDEFSPGDVVWQICPPSFYSGVRNPKPKSCELSIYGPTLEFGAMFDAKPLEENTWATTPPGTVYMCGQYSETAAETREKMEQGRKGDE